MAVRVAVFGWETGDHEVGPKLPDYPDDVGENFLPVPDAQRLVG